MMYCINMVVWDPLSCQYNPSAKTEYQDIEIAKRVFDDMQVSIGIPQISLEKPVTGDNDGDVKTLAVKYLYKNKQIVEEYDV